MEGYLGLAVGHGPIFDAGVDRAYEGWQKDYIVSYTSVYHLAGHFLCLLLCSSVS